MDFVEEEEMTIDCVPNKENSEVEIPPAREMTHDDILTLIHTPTNRLSKGRFKDPDYIRRVQECAA
jgi:hypothetical protein